MSMDSLCKAINEQEVGAGDQPRVTAEMLEMVQKDHVQLRVNVPLPTAGYTQNQLKKMKPGSLKTD